MYQVRIAETTCRLRTRTRGPHHCRNRRKAQGVPGTGVDRVAHSARDDGGAEEHERREAARKPVGASYPLNFVNRRAAHTDALRSFRQELPKLSAEEVERISALHKNAHLCGGPAEERDGHKWVLGWTYEQMGW